MNLADRIQRLRKEKGISQEELANVLGVSRQAVSKWESEQSIPDLDKIIALSEYFAVTTDYILKGTEIPAAANQKKTYALYGGLGGICAMLAGILSFTANRFRPDECLLIVLAGAVVGLGISWVIHAAASLFQK